MSINIPLFQKIIAIALVSCIILLLPPQAILILFIIAGHGHFIASYLYQYRAKKIETSFVIGYLISASILFAWIASGISSPDMIILTAGSFFIIHLFYDEIRLFSLGVTPIRIVLTLPAGFGYFILLLNATIAHPVNPTLFGIYVLVAGVASGIYAYKKDTEVQSRAFLSHMSLLTSIASVLLVSNISVSPVVIFGALILYHYSEWYLYYGFRFWHEKEKFRRYVREMAAINLFIVALYVLFLFSSSLGSPLAIFFTPLSFYGWTILHILSSLAVLRIHTPHLSQS